MYKEYKNIDHHEITEFIYKCLNDKEIINPKNSQELKFTIERFESDLSNKIEYLENEININDKDFIVKISDFLNENNRKNKFLNHDSINSDDPNKNFKIFEKYISLKSEITTEFEKEKSNKEILVSIKKLLKKLNDLYLNNESIENIINNIYIPLNGLQANLEIINDVNFSKIKNFLIKKQDFLKKFIHDKCNKQLNEELIKIEDKSISFNQNIESEKINYIQIISNVFPEYLTFYLQRFYDDFISYFHNQNYFIEKKILDDKLLYNLELTSTIDSKTKNNKLIENFEIFLEVIKKVLKILNLLLNQGLSIKFFTNSLISSHVFYGGSSKKSTNSFIFALSYQIQYFYKNFKENVLEKLKNNLDDEYLINRVSNLVLSYRNFCTEIENSFDVVKNFKFYDLNDFNADKYINTSDIRKQNNSYKQTFFEFRNRIKDSYHESKELNIKQCTILDIINDVFTLNLTNEENESIKSFTNSYKLLNLDSIINVSKSFLNFIQSFLKLTDTHLKTEILNLLYTFYNYYFKNSLSSITENLILHNNIEVLLICLQFKNIFDFNYRKNSADIDKKIIIFYKNFSSTFINQIISEFVRELISQLSLIDTLEEIRFDRNFKQVEKVLKNSLDSIIKFFSIMKSVGNEKDFLFYLNYILSLFFDILNRKVLCVKDFNLDDIKILIKISKFVSGELKSNFDKILTSNVSNINSIIFANLLENNVKYKKFEEILFVLNANLKEIKNFIIQSQYNIHIDPIELIDLIKSTFEDNTNRNNLIAFIEKTCLNNN